MKNLILNTFFAISFALAQNTVAVLDFEPIGLSKDEIRALSIRFSNEFMSTSKGQYKMVERQQVNSILKEQGFQQVNNCSSSDCGVKIGEALGAKFIVVGSISKIGNLFSVNAKLINVESSELIKSISHDQMGDLVSLMTNGMKESAQKLLAETFVQKIQNNNNDEYSKVLRITLDGYLEGFNYTEAYKLYKNNPDNIFISEKVDEFSKIINFSSSEQKVSGYYQFDLDSLSEDSWRFLCDLPCDARLPLGTIKYKFLKKQFSNKEVLLPSWADSIYITMRNDNMSKNDMIFINGGDIKLRTAGLDHIEPEKVENYYIDKYEVTNSDFLKFVKAGGYTNSKYWENGGDKHLKSFVDKTGFNSPSTWELGTYPFGESDYPVSGISWYEALAYCNSIGKTLPNIYQWDNASSMRFSNEIVPRSNINGSKKLKIGEKQIISQFGVYDMSGNVSEWVQNDSDNSTKVIMGGSWKDESYIFNTLFNKDPLDRNESNGCRCVDKVDKNSNLLKKVTNPTSNVINTKPVSDDVFNVYLSMFQYSKGKLKPEVLADTLIESGSYSIKKVLLNTPYGEKLPVYLYTPNSVNKKTRAVVLFPGSGSINRESSDQLFNAIPGRLEFLMKINTIVAIPVYKSTYERRDGLMNSIPFYDYSYRDRVINWSKDLQLTVDYLETLKIVDKKDLHYFGFSWGARVAGIMLATEKRFKSAILVVGGLRSQKRHPEADPVNYLTRVKIPILMLNGKYDPIFPFKSSAEPMFNYFGTEIGSKKMYTFETGHFVPRNEIIKHSVMWLNDLD